MKLSTYSTRAPSMRMGACPPFPVVHSHLLCLYHVEVEVVILAPYSQVSDLLPIDCLIVVGDQAVGALESCLAMQPWGNREYRRGPSTRP